MKKRVIVFVLALMLFAALAVSVPPTPAAASEESDTAYTPEQLLALWYQIGALLKENGNYPYVELQKGDRGYEVRLLQARLAELNYYSKALDDNFGSGTYAGMRKFESINGLHVNGVASVADQQLLFSSIALPNTGDATSQGDDSSSNKGDDSSSNKIDTDLIDDLQTVKPPEMTVTTPKPTIGFDLSDFKPAKPMPTPDPSIGADLPDFNPAKPMPTLDTSIGVHLP